MTKFLFGVATAAIVAIAPAAAQPAPPVAPGAPQVQVPALRVPARQQTRDQVVLRVRERFARLDTDRDGFLTRAESAAAKQGMAGSRRVRIARRLANRGANAPNRAAAFDRIDANKDGMITRQEFVAARPQVKTRVMRMGGRGGGMFAKADANRDGRVSLQEMTGAALQRFDNADLNRDGRITPEERMQRRQRVRAQRIQS